MESDLLQLHRPVPVGLNVEHQEDWLVAFDHDFVRAVKRLVTREHFLPVAAVAVYYRQPEQCRAVVGGADGVGSGRYFDEIDGLRASSLPAGREAD
jgi:hypothetical protein